MNIKLLCFKCGAILDIAVTFATPGKLSGPPENCYPPEDGFIEPSECPECNASIDEGTCQEEAIKKYQDEVVERSLDRREGAD